MQKSWSQVWLEVAQVIAQRSRCSRAQVGAVIVDSKKRVIATGYNGPASNLSTTGNCLNWCERAQGKTDLSSSYDGCPSIHAEANALLYVDRSAIEGGTIYITHPPCFSCAKLISNSGLSAIYCIERKSDAFRSPWKSYELLEDCGIQVQVHSAS